MSIVVVDTSQAAWNMEAERNVAFGGLDCFCDG